MRNLSNETIKNYIEKEYGFKKKDIKQIILATIVFEDGRTGTTIHLNDEYIDFDEDVIVTESNMVELQEEIKELGQFIYHEYGIIARSEVVLFSGLNEETYFKR